MFPVQKTCSLVGQSDGGQRGGHGLDGGQVDPERRQLGAAVAAALSAHSSRPRILPRHLRTRANVTDSHLDCRRTPIRMQMRHRLKLSFWVG